MKTMKNMPMKLVGALALVLMLAFNSCKEEEKSINLVFPELKEITGQPGDILDITFSATLDWSIQSNAGWCKFVNGEFEETTSSGKAGDQTLKISISDESWNYQTEDVAELTLKMIDQTQVIYKITRAKREYQDLLVVDSEGNKVGESFVIKGNTGSVVYTSLKASAENGVKIGVQYPEWLVMTYNSASGYYDFTFNTDTETNGGLDFRYPHIDEQSFITFVTEDAETAETDKIRKVAIPVSYEGFDKETILIEPSYMDLTVSYDGKINFDGQELTELTSKITAFENDFEVVIGTQTTNEEGSYVYDFSGNVDWIQVAKAENSSEVKVKFSENIATDGGNSGDASTYSNGETVGSRSAIAFVLPKIIYEEAKSDLNAYILDAATGDINSSLNTFILFTAEQEVKVEANAEITFMVRSVVFIEDNPWSQGPTFNFTALESFDNDVLNLNGKRLIFSDIVDDELTTVKTQYGLTTDNIYKTQVDSDYQKFLSSGMMIVFEAEGMGTDQTIELATENNLVSSQYVEGKAAYTDKDFYNISGLAIGVNGTMPEQLDIVVKNPDGTIVAFCRIKFVS